METTETIPGEESKGTATSRVDRRQSLLKATFEIIATEGFEGLRTRSVAERAGVNIATLHYYYPTKENLIEAFAAYLGQIFINLHAPPVPSTGRRGLDRLRQEFADSAFYLSEHQDLMAVMGELGLRARRDPLVQQNLQWMLYYWRQNLAGIVQEGVQDGSFRPDIDPDQATTTLIALFSGMGVLNPEDIEHVRQAVEQWLVCPEEEREVSDEPAKT